MGCCHVDRRFDQGVAATPKLCLSILFLFSDLSSDSVMLPCWQVSGQLNAEYYACALTNVYTFGPTFRAENSHTVCSPLAPCWDEVLCRDLHLARAELATSAQRHQTLHQQL